MVEQGGRGGEADYSAQLTRELAALGWQVVLATADDNLFEPVEGVAVRGIFHYTRGHSALGRLLRGARIGRVANGMRFLAAVPRLVGLARQADIVHVQGWEFAPLGLIAVVCLRLSGATVVQTRHNTFERGDSLTQTKQTVWRILAKLTERTIVHTQADIERLPPSSRIRAVVIPHGDYGDLAQSGGEANRDEARSRLGIPADSPVAMMFGQLRTDKGLNDLLAAASRTEGLYLLIAGQELGALAAGRSQLESPELAGRVIVREGFLDMAEAAQLFAAADAVVLPYEVASQSGVLLLAYGFQRPVIVYPLGGLIEAVVDGETGWICSRSDPQALADTLAEFAAAGWPECRRRGALAAQLARERFGWPMIARRTSELYGEVLAGD
jgi:glycosyltransferase involved in cell wall biosynthesis